MAWPALYRSTNNGTSATAISNGGTYGLPGGAVSDIVADPKVQNYFYAAVIGANAGIYGSQDGGVHWVDLSGTGTSALPVTTANENIKLPVTDASGGGGTTTTIDVGLIDGSGNLTGVYQGAIRWTATNGPTYAASAVWKTFGADQHRERHGLRLGNDSHERPWPAIERDRFLARCRSLECQPGLCGRRHPAARQHDLVGAAVQRQHHDRHLDFAHRHDRPGRRQPRPGVHEQFQRPDAAGSR